MSHSEQNPSDYEVLSSTLDICLFGIQSCMTVKGKLMVNKKKLNEQRDQSIEDFLKQMENIIRECSKVRCFCLENEYMALFKQLIEERKNYSSSIIPRIFSILITLFSDRNAISSYVTYMESQNLNSVIWDDTFFSTIYKCRLDPTLAEMSFQLIYYMLYNKGCVLCFRNDNLLPKIICNAEGIDESITITPALQKIASSILEKVVLEGGQTALQYCSNMELFMLLNSSNYIARMGALVMMADLCHWSVQPVHYLIEDRQDLFRYDCFFRLEDGEELEGIAMCLREELLYLYRSDDHIEFHFYCVIGLNNVFFSNTSSKGGYSCCLYLPGRKTLNIRFSKESALKQWMTMIQSFMKEYDEKNYALSGVNVCHLPYLNTKYFFTEENNDFIGVYLIQSIRSFLEQPSEIPESLVYISRLLYYSSTTENGIELIMQNNLLEKIIPIILTITPEIIEKKRKQEYYRSMDKMDATNIVINIHLYLIQCIRNLCIFDFAISTIIQSYPTFISFLLDRLADPLYHPGTLTILRLIKYLLQALPVDSSPSSILNQCHFDVLFKAYERPFTKTHRITYIRYFKHIVRQYVKFGPNFIIKLVNSNFLEDLLRLRRFPSISRNPDLFNRTTEMIDVTFGSFSEVAKVLTISQLYSLLPTGAPHAILRALEELHVRLPGIISKANEAFQHPSIDIYVKNEFPSLLGVLPRLPSISRPATTSRSQSNDNLDLHSNDDNDNNDDDDDYDNDNGGDGDGSNPNKTTNLHGDENGEVFDEVLGVNADRAKRNSCRNSVAFLDDYLSQSTTYFRNQKRELDRTLHHRQHADYPFANSSSIVYRHQELRGLEIDFVAMSMKYKETLKQFEVIYQNIRIISSVLSNAMNLKYTVVGGQSSHSQDSDRDTDSNDRTILHTSIACRVGQVLSYHCNNDVLCNLLWDTNIVMLVFAYISGATTKAAEHTYAYLDNDATVFSLGYMLLLFFRRYRGDISEVWVKNDSLLKHEFANLKLIKHVLLKWNCEITTKALFTILTATLLRCPQLCSDFMRVMPFGSLVKQVSEELPLMMESTAYLIGTLSQIEEHRQRLIEVISPFIEKLCNLRSYPNQTISAMVYALQRFVLSDLGKNCLVQNKSNVLTDLITMYHGKSISNPDQPVSTTLRRRVCTLLSYLFHVVEPLSKSTLSTLGNNDLIQLLFVDISLVRMCTVKLLADKLVAGSPPARDFVYNPILSDYFESRSNGRRSTWTTYNVVLNRDRLLLYRVNSCICNKTISLHESEQTTNPEEAHVRGMKIASHHDNTSYRILRFTNNDQARQWDRCIQAIINNQLPTFSSTDITNIINSYDYDHDLNSPMPDYTRLASTVDQVDPKHWGMTDYMLPSELNDDCVRKLIQELLNPSLLTRIHAARAVAAVFTCGTTTFSSNVYDTFLSTFRAIRKGIQLPKPTEEHLFRQAFFTSRPGYWVCSICLTDSPQQQPVCSCCGGPCVDGLNSCSSGLAYMNEQLARGLSHYLFECLLVCSSSPDFVNPSSMKDLVEDLNAALVYMCQGALEGVVITCKLLMNVLRHAKGKECRELVEFFMNKDLYKKIQEVLRKLPADHTSLFPLYHLTNLISMFCTFNPNIFQSFINNDGIKILLDIYNFSLPANQRTAIVDFVGNKIRMLWDGGNKPVLSVCSLHQLLGLLLWAADNEQVEDINNSIGYKVMDVLKQYADGRDEKNADKNLTSQQRDLLKFGIQRLLVLVDTITYYTRFRTLPNTQQGLHLYICECTLMIILSLSNTLKKLESPKLARHFFKHDIIPLLLRVVRAPWIPNKTRDLGIECLLSLLENNSNAANEMLTNDQTAVGKLIAYLHERIHTNDPKNPEALHVQPVSSLFKLFIVLAKIGSGALQLVKGNVLFTVMVVMKSKDEQYRLLAAKLLWTILNKQCAFLGSPIGHSFSITSLLMPIGELLRSVTIIQRSPTIRFLLYLVNSLTVLAFSGERRVAIREEVWTVLLEIAESLKVDVKGEEWRELGVPYTPLQCLQILLSRSRDGWSVLPCLSLPFLTKLISNTKKDSFLTWIALTELTRRLARSLTCTMEELPVSDQNITAVMHYQQEEEQNVRVFFYGTDSLWIYFKPKNVMICWRVYLPGCVLKVDLARNTLSIKPREEADSQQSILLSFNDPNNPQVLENWYSTFLQENPRLVNAGVFTVKAKTEAQRFSEKAGKQTAVFVREFIESTSSSQKFVIHHSCVELLSVDKLEKVLGEKGSVINRLMASPSRQLAETAKRLKEMVDVMNASRSQSSTYSVDSMKSIVQSIQDTEEIMIPNEFNWSNEMPMPPAPIPEFKQ